MLDRDAVRQSLPPNVTLDTVVRRETRDKIETVEMELLRLGAFVDGKGTLRDASGKEIRFVREPVPTGTPPVPRPPTPEDLRKQAEWEKFHKDFRVISLTWNPNFDPSPP